MPNSDNIALRQLDIELFGGCNYACQMCPQSTGREKEFLKSIPLDIFKKIIDDAAQHNIEVVTLHGSGEPMLYKRLPEAIQYVKQKGMRCYSFTNGYNIRSWEIIESGLDFLRVSAIGYDRESYKKWMSKDTFELVRKNIRDFIELNRSLNGTTKLRLYHLITDINDQEWQKQQYLKNWVDYTGAEAEIWLMHNWSGSFSDAPYKREELLNKLQKRTCGRPFAPMLQVRAGGLGSHYGAVVACCMTLGQDSKAVLGHLDTQTIKEILQGEKYEELRQAHLNEEFDKIDYCKNCDQLYDLPESLVWTNVPDREYNQSVTTSDFYIKERNHV